MKQTKFRFISASRQGSADPLAFHMWCLGGCCRANGALFGAPPPALCRQLRQGPQCSLDSQRDSSTKTKLIHHQSIIFLCHYFIVLCIVEIASSIISTTFLVSSSSALGQSAPRLCPGIASICSTLPRHTPGPQHSTFLSIIRAFQHSSASPATDRCHGPAQHALAAAGLHTAPMARRPGRPPRR
jgi:hypothetical protein